MLRSLFIPVLLVLVTIAAALYWLLHDSRAPKTLREAVPVERFTLRNGLTVLVMPNSRVPAVTHILFVRAGGADDPYGKTGLAHFLEHLMFSGTKDYPEGVYDRTISKVGGEQNAYTQRDFTAYYATVPKDALKQVMAMESDRLMHLEINDFHAARELKVITEERNMRVENKAPDLLAEQIDAITFLNHPYGHPLIGWAEDMASFTSADARSFFKKHYRAGNMVLVVAGDVDVGEVRRMAQHYYGALPAGAAIARHWPQEPPIRMSRRGEMEDAKAREPRLMRQYVAPSVNAGATAQAMPLALFVHYLGGGSTSLLYRTLVLEKKLATNLYASYDPLDVGPSLVRIWAVPAPGVSLPQLEKALDAAIEDSLGSLPAEDEVARAKTQLKAEVIYAQDGLEPLAHLIGQLVMIGKDEGYFYSWIDAVEAVGATDMLEAAQLVLDPARRVTGYLTPAQDAGTGDENDAVAAPVAAPAAEAEGAQP
jgi:zinc protease